ncbi:hypothetical protein F5884DRAFT_820433 [Xylogone sp. PMI_703]|nr:hypothetical protein F5884DRAFT_820433 [Xylogone sp. PMI_703]
MATVELPKTMKGVVIEKTGGVEVLQYKTDLPVPTPGEGQVLVKNDFIGINYIDTYFRSGLYPAPQLPLILGREAEGHVAALGPTKTDLVVSDRVVYLPPNTAYAEYTLAPLIHTARVPEGVPPGIAAASLLQGLTALTLIRESYPVKKGDWILVHAAAGGVGLWLCQLLKAVGARTIGTASTPEKIQLAKDNGAEFMINYRLEGEEGDVVKKVNELTGGAGVAAVFDGVGKDTFEIDLQVVARKGTLVSFGNASGTVPPFTINRLSPKNIKLLRPMLFPYITLREEFDQYTTDLFRFITEGKIKVHVHETYPLEEVGRAHTDLEGRKTTGKLLLKP